jgi:hypothetical protein
MSAKTALVRGGQYLLLTVLYLLFFMAGSSLGGDTSALGTVPADQEWLLFPALILVCLVDVALVMLVVRRSLWRGWRLMLGVLVSLYGVITVMSLIEVLWFGPAMGIPASIVPGLFLNWLPVALGFVPLAVWILGRARPWHAVSAAARTAYARLQMPAVQWVWKLALIAAAYLVFYFGFGFVVAWQNPALRDLYGGGANQDVFDWWRLIPFQLFRGVLWALFALPVIAMDRGPAWQTAVVVGLWLALPMNIVHAVPNPLMPDVTVRLSHFIETSTSNFLFGLFLTSVLLWRPQRKPRPAAGSVTV